MHLPLAAFLARRFRDRGESLDDLTQVATIGLIKAVDRFDARARGGVLDVRHPHDRGRDQAALPRQGLGDPRAPTAAGAADLPRPRDRRAQPVDRPLPDRRRARRAPRRERGRRPGGPGVGAGLRHPVAGRLLGRRRRRGRLLPGRHPRRGRPRRWRGRDPRDAAPPAGGAAGARAADPATAVLREHDPGPDRRGGRRLPDARLPAAGQVAGAAAQRASSSRPAELTPGPGRCQAELACTAGPQSERRSRRRRDGQHARPRTGTRPTIGARNSGQTTTRANGLREQERASWPAAGVAAGPTRCSTAPATTSTARWRSSATASQASTQAEPRALRQRLPPAPRRAAPQHGQCRRPPAIATRGRTGSAMAARVGPKLGT